MKAFIDSSPITCTASKLYLLSTFKEIAGNKFQGLSLHSVRVELTYQLMVRDAIESFGEVQRELYLLSTFKEIAGNKFQGLSLHSVRVELTYQLMVRDAIESFGEVHKDQSTNKSII